MDSRPANPHFFLRNAYYTFPRIPILRPRKNRGCHSSRVSNRVGRDEMRARDQKLPFSLHHDISATRSRIGMNEKAF